MKLFDGGRAANPRRTRIFLAEKGISLPVEQVDWPPCNTSFGFRRD